MVNKKRSFGRYEIEGPNPGFRVWCGTHYIETVMSWESVLFLIKSDIEDEIAELQYLLNKFEILENMK